MVNRNLGNISESEEMYLITIARLVEQGVEEPISISRLAEELAIQPVSANQMIHKLAEEELVKYLPYKGVLLTANGQEIAIHVLRDRRLWEVFLIEHLGLPPSEADALACRLEHITPKGVTCRLASFLGHPAVTPQGFPIPEVNGETNGGTAAPLAELAVEEWGEIVRVESDAVTQAFLEKEGIRPGQKVNKLAIGDNGSILLRVRENHIHLARSVANQILIHVQSHQDIKE
jgi:DtxR family Mn-dependent transcriptional regulator